MSAIVKHPQSVLALGLAFLTHAASASEYGCKVLLCLANPAGPTAVTQCVPPITQLWRDLAALRPFPSCDEAKPSAAIQQMSYYDACPAGTTALAANAQARQADSSSVVVGIGTGDDLKPWSDGTTSTVPGKVCVGTLLKSVTVGDGQQGDSGAGVTTEIGIYDRVLSLDPYQSPRAVDVYIGGILYRRIRW